jgi:hypothetical protein
VPVPSRSHIGQRTTFSKQDIPAKEAAAKCSEEVTRIIKQMKLKK